MRKSWKSTFVGVSTFAGTLKVGNLESTGGTFNGTFVNADNGSFNVLEAVNSVICKAGIVTDLHVTVGVVTNGLYLILVLQLYLMLEHNMSMRIEYSQVLQLTYK